MDHSIPGFNWEQVNGCRILGPRKGDENYNPPLGSEVFVGKLPRDCFEFELYQFMSKVGPVYDIRLMVTLYGENRGFAFVRFYDPETAAKAIDEMNQKTIRPGRRIGVTISTDHRTLLLIGLDCRVSRDDIFKVCDSALPGNLMLVTELPSARPSYLLQYATHRAAAITKRSQTQMLPPQWGPSVRIIWQHNEEVEMRNKNRRSREAVRRMVELYKQKFSKQSLESSAILPVTETCTLAEDTNNLDLNMVTLSLGKDLMHHLTGGDMQEGTSSLQRPQNTEQNYSPWGRKDVLDEIAWPDDNSAKNTTVQFPQPSTSQFCNLDVSDNILGPLEGVKSCPDVLFMSLDHADNAGEGREEVKENYRKQPVVAYVRPDPAAGTFTLDNTPVEQKSEQNSQMARVAYVRADVLGLEASALSQLCHKTSDATGTSLQAPNNSSRPILGQKSVFQPQKSLRF
ncbi:uncharacterized protein LOC124354442 isoform X2 [Homalodisca vitripennis]|uniref:uncharacterized protein LOC124354442 isoform X2 n=1 Tax=Homalodisca vitripennis TaxID=197043 RepID=UPI001EEC4208|nr:uncharacterized protein LOC124354442 isoform X2 [Homalodisca vitripennis]